jgi:hypothetical protein
MPLYSYRCLDCDETIDVLHAVDAWRTRCGLDCKRKGAGEFGAGRVDRVLTAAALGRTVMPIGEGGTVASGDAMRKAALDRVGGPPTERELGTLEKAGMTVYRKAGAGTWERAGSEDGPTPKRIGRPK